MVVVVMIGPVILVVMSDCTVHVILVFISDWSGDCGF